MEKQFAKVTHTRVTKNKLQQVILNELQQVDCTLYRDKKNAKTSIEQLFKNAVSQYKGKATPQELKSWESDKKTLNFQVEEVISISVYNVKIDLT